MEEIKIENIKANIAFIDTSVSYWAYHMKQRKVKPLKKPCHDCAITTGFYVDMAEELKKESPETVSAVIDTWFCHNHCNRGCAGVREYLNKSKEMETKLKELDPEKIKNYGKLSDNEDDLSKLVFIKKEKTKLIFNKFKTRR